MRIAIVVSMLLVLTVAGFSQENDIDKAKETIVDFKEVDASISALSSVLSDMLFYLPLERAESGSVVQVGKELFSRVVNPLGMSG